MAAQRRRQLLADAEVARAVEQLQAELQRVLAQRVRRLYLEEYIKVWDAYLADVQLLRSLVWAAGFACVAALLVQAMAGAW